MVDGIHRGMLILLIVIIDELDGHFGICGGIKGISLPHQLILQLLIILYNAVVNADYVVIVGAMGMRIGLIGFPVGSPAGMTDAAGAGQGLAFVGLLCQDMESALCLDDADVALAVPHCYACRIISSVL